MAEKEYKVVGKPMRKKDSIQLLSGNAAYTDDLARHDALVVKLLRSPHPHAMVESIDTAIAKKVPGVVDIYTWEDVPQTRFAIAGQTFPEASPHDRLILDRHVRFSGDPVAIVAAETKEAAEKALRLIKVKYQVLLAVLDPKEALDNAILIHPEDGWTQPGFWAGDPKRNLVMESLDENGDPEKVFGECDLVLEREFHTKAFNQAMAETFRTYTELDSYGRLHVISSTQIVFHIRRILATALEMPMSRIRVEKPRIGGGFGAKQTAVSEVYPAFVTVKTGRPAEIIYTREESQIAGSPRHEMILKVRLGAMSDGRIRGIDMYTLSNTGAYGEHGPTTVGLSGQKTISLYSGGCLEAYRFRSQVVYTNRMPAGAYRGYGATQGFFALESVINEMAETLHLDPVEVRLKNIVRVGDVMHPLSHEVLNSSSLRKCIETCKERFDWDAKYPVRDMGNGKVRSAGMAIAMQGSCISNIDVGSATVKLTEDGSYNLILGAADMGTGCDTILAQMAAEVLECDFEDVAVFEADTDISPYDSGSYASSTTYLTGRAVEKACLKLRDQLLLLAAKMLGCEPSDLTFVGKAVRSLKTDASVSLRDLGMKSQEFNDIATMATATETSPISPPPFMVGMIETETDTETGFVKVLDYQGVIDCGYTINPNLARIQAEGGVLQGIGHTLMEDIHYGITGRPIENSLMQYKIPTRLDAGHMDIQFENSYEPTGPFGAKSIGELVINTPAPALAHAIYRATGAWHRELPITPEKVLFGN